MLLARPSEVVSQVFAINAGDIVAANYRAGGSTVVRVNPQTGAIRRIGLFNFPTDVTLSPDGYLYVSELGGQIKRINLTNGVETVVNPATALSQVWGLALGPDGNLFVTTSVGDRVVKVNPVTGAESDLVAAGQLSSPRGIDFLDSNHVVVASRGNNRVVSVSLLDQSQTTLAQGANGIDLPWGISVFNDNIYVGALDSRLLFRINGSTITNILPAASPKLAGGPYGIGTDLNGNIVIGVSGGLAGPYALERRDVQGNPLPGFSGNYIGEITGVEISKINILAGSQINTAPQLPLVGESIADEGVAMAFTADGVDSDWPLQELTYQLVGNVPAGAALAANGVFTWKPAEAQGPSTNLFTMVVVDDGMPSLSATQTFTIVVNEVNSPPLVTPVGDKTVVVGSLLNFKVNATDGDLPSQVLLFSLEPDAPLGASITANGDFTWIPGQSPGPGDYMVGVTVTDDGDPPLSDTQYFNVAVREVNVPPALGVITNQVVDEGTLLSLQLVATDANLPAQALTFGFAVDPPSGAAISAAGLFTWSPTESQGPSTNAISVRVTDNGVPPLSVTNNFTVVVREANRAPVLDLITNRTANPGSVVAFNATASDADLPAQSLTFSLAPGAPIGATITPAGSFNWPIDAAEPAGAHVITVSVKDDGNPSLAVSRSFTVEVQGGFHFGDGDVIVADYGANAVIKIDRQSGAAQSLGTFLSPTDVAVTPDGILYVAEQSGAIERLDSRTGAVTLVNPGSGLFDLRSITIGPGGELYVTTGWDDGVVRVDPATGAETLVTQGDLISGPFGVAMLNSTHLLVSSHYVNRLVAVALTNNTQYVVAEGNGINQPWGVAVSAGVVFVVSQGAQAVQTVSGGIATDLLTTVDSPLGIGIGSGGGLSISVNGATPKVACYSAAGVPTADYQLGLTGFGMGVEVVTAPPNNPPVPGTNVIYRLANVGTKVRTDQLLGIDPDGDAITFQSASPSSLQGGVVVASAVWLLYAPPSGFSGNDSFTYTVRDSQGATAVGTVVVNVVADTATSANLITQDFGNGSTRLRFSGIPDTTYIIQYSTDAQTPNWQNLSWIVSDTYGAFELVDTPPSGQLRRYRSVAP